MLQKGSSKLVGLGLAMASGAIELCNDWTGWVGTAEVGMLFFDCLGCYAFDYCDQFARVQD